MFRCSPLVSSNIRLCGVLHCISCHVMSQPYTRVEMDDLNKLSFSVGKEKDTFVVSGFAMKEFKSAIS